MFASMISVACKSCFIVNIRNVLSIVVDRSMGFLGVGCWMHNNNHTIRQQSAFFLLYIYQRMNVLFRFDLCVYGFLFCLFICFLFIRLLNFRPSNLTAMFCFFFSFQFSIIVFLFFFLQTSLAAA